MSYSNLHNTVITVSEKLGISDVSLQKKGEEFLITYGSKSLLKNINDHALAVLCLDLASNLLGIGFDKEMAIRISGLKKTQYRNSLHNIEKILNLDKPLTIPELCVQFSCTVAKETALKILDKYKQTHNIDSTHNQYSTICVYLACKIHKVSVDRKQFLPLSRLKPSQWKELEETFKKFIDTLGFQIQAKGRPRKNANDFENFLQEEQKVKENEHKTNQQDVKELEEEDYEVWKKRILEEARAALSKAQMNNENGTEININEEMIAEVVS